MHFIPEYFPHRELGIVLLGQGRAREAIAELETSLAQQPSARGAYYLNEARAAYVRSSNGDHASPIVDITSPTDGAIAGLSADVAGVARDDTFVRRIIVGQHSCPVPVSGKEIPFSQRVSLTPGTNEIPITVEDIVGNVTSTHLQIRSDVDGPVVSFDAPVVLPGHVMGVVYDSSGVASMSVSGKHAELSPAAGGVMRFAVDLERSDMVAPAAYEARDGLGNTTRGRVPLDTLLVSELNDSVVLASDGLSTVNLTPTLFGLYAGAQLIAVAASGEEKSVQDGPRVRFANLLDGQKFLLEEIVASVDIDAQTPVVSISINGAAVDTIPGRTSVRLARRLHLDPGVNSIEVRAEDSGGRETVSKIRIERQLTAVEQQASKLSVAVLGNIREGNSPQIENEESAIVDELLRALQQSERFLMVDRSLLPDILTEQLLSEVLASKKERLALRKVIPAEIFLIGRVRRDADTIEIAVYAISTETSAFVGRADVAGPANDRDQVRTLISDLALALVQAFPRAQGEVALVKQHATIATNLGRPTGVRESMKLVVFRPGADITDPITKESIGRDTEILGEAIVKSVEDDMSTAECTRTQEAEAKQIQVGDLVVTK